MIIEILEALLEAWLSTMTPADIACDPDKVMLLKRVTESDVRPTPFVRDLYEEVFLRDVWTRERSAA